MVFPELFRSKTFRQTTSLFGSDLFLLGLSIVTAPIVTRTFGPLDYGILALFLTITRFALNFFNFGYLFTVGVMLAESKSGEEQRHLIGSSFVIALLLGLSYALCIFLFSFFADSLFDTSVGKLLRIVVPFLIFYPVYMLYPQIGKGTNRIDSMVYTRGIPYILRFLVIVILWITGSLSLLSLVILEAVISVISTGIVYHIFKPSFSALRSTTQRLMNRNREVGFHIYIAQVAAQSTYELDGIMIPFFAGPVQLGYYRLATIFPQTMNGFSISLSTSQFRDYAHKNHISGKTLLVNYAVLAAGALGTIFLGKHILGIITGAGFEIPFSLILPAGILGFVHGAYQPYTHFINARGKGKWIRNIGFVTMAVNIIGNFTLIPFFGATGAAWASVLSRGSGYIANMYYYRRIKN